MKSNRTEEIALATATHGNNIQKNTATALVCAEKKEHAHFLKGSKSNKHAHTLTPTRTLTTIAVPKNRLNTFR